MTVKQRLESELEHLIVARARHRQALEAATTSDACKRRLHAIERLDEQIDALFMALQATSTGRHRPVAANASG